jgi:hypothetical protein
LFLFKSMKISLFSTFIMVSKCVSSIFANSEVFSESNLLLEFQD